MSDDLHESVMRCADKIERSMKYDRELCEDLAFLAVCAEQGIGCEPTGEWFAPYALSAPEYPSAPQPKPAVADQGLGTGELAVMPERTGVVYWEGWQTDPKWWKMLVEHCQREDIPVNIRKG